MSGSLALAETLSLLALAPLQLSDILSLDALLTILFDGLSKAAVYAMLAMGLTLIFGLMGVLNFAHGSLTMLGAYLGGLFMLLFVTNSTGGVTRLAVFFVGLVVVFGLLSALGGALEVGLIRPLYDRPPIYQILLTFGITLVIDELVRIVVLFYGLQPVTEWQDAFGTKPDFLASQLEFGPVSVGGMDLFEMLLGALVVAVVWAFLTRTRYGLVVRAGSEDAEMTEALGIDVRRVFTTVFALGAGLAGVAGMLLMWDSNWGASVPLATEALLPAFVVVIIGGLGTFRGTVVAALVVGFADAVAQWLFVNAIDFPPLPELTVFLALVVMLVLRPQGIFGRAEVGGH
jgi:branched-chain amino acid transport system permease protein